MEMAQFLAIWPAWGHARAYRVYRDSFSPETALGLQ